MIYAPPQAIRDLWPTPPLGDWAVRDVHKPVPVAGGDGFRMENENLEQRFSVSDEIADTGVGEPVNPAISEGAYQYAANRGIADRGAYAETTFNKHIPHLVTHSLGREILYNWADAQFNVGGVTYPLDYGFGPGAHYDATLEMGNVQLYMKPGIFRRSASQQR